MNHIRLTVQAGPHNRHYTPVAFTLPDQVTTGRLINEELGEEIPCQVSENILNFIIASMPTGVDGRYLFYPGKESAASTQGVKVRHKNRSKSIEFRVLGHAFTTYHYSTDCPRPFLHPLLGPHKKPVTRAYPMENVDGETADHKHHRGVWVAYGDVNGTDNWTEDGNHGWQAHQSFDSIIEGPVFGELRERLHWEGPGRNEVMEEIRSIRIYATPASTRCVDLRAELIASFGDVRLGDTKEGGICSVRVATSMDGDKGGQIRTSSGGVGETECWGKPAHWCDYEGQVEGNKVGIAIFDHPLNFRHPTCWHVRDYGLMTANPFGYSDFQSSFLKNGTHTISAGDTLPFQYRLYIHKPDSRRSTVADRYQDFANPPKVTSDEGG
jgi:hypothetical protein